MRQGSNPSLKPAGLTTVSLYVCLALCFSSGLQVELLMLKWFIGAEVICGRHFHQRLRFTLDGKQTLLCLHVTWVLLVFWMIFCCCCCCCWITPGPMTCIEPHEGSFLKKPSGKVKKRSDCWWQEVQRFMAADQRRLCSSNRFYQTLTEWKELFYHSFKTQNRVVKYEKWWCITIKFKELADEIIFFLIKPPNCNLCICLQYIKQIKSH